MKDMDKPEELRGLPGENEAPHENATEMPADEDATELRDASPSKAVAELLWHGEPHSEVNAQKALTRFQDEVGANDPFERELAGDWYVNGRLGDAMLSLMVGASPAAIKAFGMLRLRICKERMNQAAILREWREQRKALERLQAKQARDLWPFNMTEEEKQRMRDGHDKLLEEDRQVWEALSEEDRGKYVREWKCKQMFARDDARDEYGDSKFEAGRADVEPYHHFEDLPELVPEAFEGFDPKNPGPEFSYIVDLLAGKITLEESNAIQRKAAQDAAVHATEPPPCFAEGI